MTVYDDPENPTSSELLVDVLGAMAGDRAAMDRLLEVQHKTMTERVVEPVRVWRAEHPQWMPLDLSPHVDAYIAHVMREPAAAEGLLRALVIELVWVQDNADRFQVQALTAVGDRAGLEGELAAAKETLRAYRLGGDPVDVEGDIDAASE